jgi:arylsulfatase
MPNPLDRRHLGALGHAPDVAPAHTIPDQSQHIEPREWLTTPLRSPNVLLVLTSGPTQDCLRSTRVHTAALRSPAGAAPDHHGVGSGAGVEMGSATSGYDGMGLASAAMLADFLSQDGYATAAFGNGRPTSEHDADGRPDFGAFDSIHGLHGAGGASGAIVRGATLVTARRRRAHKCHVAADVVDRAIRWVDDLRASHPEKPWFTCLSFDTSHPGLADAQIERFVEHLHRSGELDSTIVLR